jgi:hypothetical protein
MPQKYEREIDEILRRMDSGPAPTGRVLTPLPPIERPAPRRPRLNWSPRFRVNLNASTLMIGALSLAIVTYPLQWVYPPAVAAAGLVSAAMLIGAVLLSIFGSRSTSGPTRSWRGQPMELNTGGFRFDFGFGAIARRWRRWKARRRFRDPRWN